jgi:hypothetical protein
MTRFVGVMCVFMACSCGAAPATDTADGAAPATDTADGAAPATDTADGSDQGDATSSELPAPSLEGLQGPCTADSDCMFACTTDYCGECRCDATAILASESATLEERKQALAAECPAQPVLCSVWPPPPTAMCAGGTCHVDWSLDPADFDTACEVDEDCVIASTDACNNVCPCPSVAIAKTALDAWDARDARADSLRIMYCPMSSDELGEWCAAAGMCADPTAQCTDGACTVDNE